MIGVTLGLPGASIPNHDRTATVSSFRNSALEAAVFDGMILGLHRQALHPRIERGTFGHSPAQKHATELEPKVIVEVARVVLLDHVATAAFSRGFAGGLAGFSEIALPSVLGQTHASAPAQLRRLAVCVLGARFCAALLRGHRRVRRARDHLVAVPAVSGLDA